MSERQADQRWVEDTRAEYLRRANEASAFGRFERGCECAVSMVLRPMMDRAMRAVKAHGLPVPHLPGVIPRHDGMGNCS